MEAIPSIGYRLISGTNRNRKGKAEFVSAFTHAHAPLRVLWTWYSAKKIDTPAVCAACIYCKIFHSLSVEFEYRGSVSRKLVGDVKLLPVAFALLGLVFERNLVIPSVLLAFAV